MQGWARKRKRVLILCCLFFVGTQISHPPSALKGPDYSAARGDRSVRQTPLPLQVQLQEEGPGGSGLPETTRFWWEQDPAFQRLCLKNRTLVRLVAFRIGTDDATPAERHNVGVAVALIKGQVVPAGIVFSANAALGPRTGDRNFEKGLTYFGAEQIQTYGGGICRLVSALYNGAILANLEVIERWPHSMPVSYVPPGQDATIATYKDLKFRNSTTAPLVIWAEYKESTLYIAFYGREKPPKVTWHHEILARWPHTTEYRPNPRLQPGEERVISPGADGLRVRSWVTVEEPDGRRYHKRLGVDVYYPKRQVVEVNPLTFR